MLSAEAVANAFEESVSASRELATTGDKRACLEVTAGRTGLVTLAKSLVGQPITFCPSSGCPFWCPAKTGGVPRWWGIDSWTCPVNKKVPTSADCSSFVTWLFWTAYGLGEEKLNQQSWKA